MPLQEYICETCGEVVMDAPSHPRRFCSRACMGAARTAGILNTRPKAGRHDPCQACGVLIWRQPSDIRNDRRLTCSLSCASALKRTAEWEERLCLSCGESMGLRRRSDSRRSCSKKCAINLRTVNALDRTHNGVRARSNADGYVLVWEPSHPKAHGGWVYEHRLVAEQIIGRVLTSDEIVHHINRDKGDNRQKNLAVVNEKTHARLTANERLTDRQLLSEYMQRFGPLDL